MAGFSSEEFLPQSIIEHITAMRVDSPSRIEETAHNRKRRPKIAPEGRLSLLVADQPARRETQVGTAPLALANRHDLLARVVRIMSGHAADGVVGSVDLIEDLLALESLLRERGHDSILDGKLLVASLNRGGLSGSIWELNDPMTGPSLEGCAALRLDAARIVLRLSPHSAESLSTLTGVANMLRKTNAAKLPVFLEPIAVDKAKLGYDFVNDPTTLARIVGVATGLGDSSRRVWLTVPHCDDMPLIARTTTLPMLINCDHSAMTPDTLLQAVSGSLEAGSNIRGALMGTNVLFATECDPLAIAAAIRILVHDKAPLDSARQKLNNGDNLAMHQIANLF